MDLTSAPDVLSPRSGRAAAELVSLLQSQFGPSFLGLTVYGEEPAGGETDGIETVMVLAEVDFAALRRLAEHGARLGRLGLAAPLAMTPEDIESSLDSFPLELLEIQQRHVTIHGTDYFASLPFQAADVRLQCEREFKRLQMRLRQGVLTASGQAEVFDAIFVELRRHLVRTLRGFLWLKGKKEYLAPAAVCQACEQVTGSELSGLRRLLGNERPSPAVVDCLYQEISALAVQSDRA